MAYFSEAREKDILKEWQERRKLRKTEQEKTLLDDISRTFTRVKQTDFSGSSRAPELITSAKKLFIPIANRMSGERRPTSVQVNACTEKLALAAGYAGGRCSKSAVEVLSACVDALANYKYYLQDEESSTLFNTSAREP